MREVAESVRPPTTGLATVRAVAERAKPYLVIAFRFGLTVAITVFANVLVLLVVIPIGIATGELFWSVAAAEGALLVVCLGIAGGLALRARRSQSLGVIAGWVAGYLGLIGLVVALMIAAVVIILVGWFVIFVIIVPLSILVGG